MAKFSVCRIYKVTLWLNFSYNCSVNLMQILHLYIHPRWIVMSLAFASRNCRVTPKVERHPCAESTNF